MKVKEAHKLLEEYSGNDLFQEANKLFQSEVDSIILLRSHGSKPTNNLIDGAINQVNNWFKKVAIGLKWDKPDLPDKIIEWERGKVWVRYGIVDPRLLDWRKRTQREILKGSSLPMLTAMKKEDLEAASSMLLAQIQEGIRQYSEVNEKRKAFAAKMGKQLCPWGTEERLCFNSNTFSIIDGVPTKTTDLVFICMVDKCIKEEIK